MARPTVVVDLTELTFMDSSGTAALLAARQKVTDAGHGFVIRGASGFVRRVFDLSGLGYLLSD
ncbi:MAG: STAS domain-containing protein [Acidimicrobiales bacterium]